MEPCAEVHYPVDLGFQEANNLGGELRALGQHRQRVDRVLGRVVHHAVDLRVELAQQRLDLRLLGAGDGDGAGAGGGGGGAGAGAGAGRGRSELRHRHWSGGRRGLRTGDDEAGDFLRPGLLAGFLVWAGIIQGPQWYNTVLRGKCNTVICNLPSIYNTKCIVTISLFTIMWNLWEIITLQ